MKSYASVVLAAFLASASIASAACNADNCARAVGGTAFPTATRSGHLADCSSYLSCTVTTTLSGGASTVCPTAVPTYASACSGVSRYSSACICAGIKETTTTVTTTGTSASPTPDCTAIAGEIEGPDIPVTYSQYFSGTGVTENTNNPGNEYEAPITATYAGPKCAAASQCAAFAGEANYLSFDLHRSTRDTSFTCVLYYNANRDSSYFNVKDSNIAEVYGYST